MPALMPDFFLVNPVARAFRALDRFNAPREYTFAPTKLQLHEGIDLEAISGPNMPVAVLAAQRGVVDQVGFSAKGYGNYIRIVHKWRDGTWATWYGHLSKTSVQVGDFVLAGQKIGIAGTTGFSSGIHLHLTLQHIGHGLPNYVVADVVDPEPFFWLGDAPVFDDAGFELDVTIKAGTTLKPGQQFEKVWRIRNTGTTTWDAGYMLGFAGDEQMDGPQTVPLPQVPVAPGQIVNVPVKLVAPVTPGRHQGTWQVQHPDGGRFGQPLSVVIEIKETKPFDQATFVADVTIEDGTLIQPGQQFIKTWRIRNTGTTTWDERYTLRFVQHERMGGPDQVPLARKVNPGEVTEISVTLTAPRAAGRHRSTWKLHNPDAKPFDYELFADIQVPQGQADQPTDGLNEMRWVADVTVPDYSQMQPGQSFVKTWRVRNSGTTTWGQGYTLAFFGDEKMSGPGSVPLPAARPGEMVDISLTLVAPTRPGQYRSTWKARDPKGKIFEFDLFALIEVPQVDQPEQVDEMGFVTDVTVDDGTVMSPGQVFVKTWRVRNTGTTTWGEGYSLAFSGDERLSSADSVPLPAAKPGQTVDVSVMMTAPTTPGLHRSTWKGRNPQGQVFKRSAVFALIDVVDPSQVYDMLPFLRGDGRLYDLEYNWSGGGRQRLQTQSQGNRFYHVKNTQWEELWADDHFIYRGTDTSAGMDEVYSLFEQGRYGSAWIPRHMTIGAPFRRMPLVMFRRKADGAELRHFIHVTWIKLVAVHRRLKLFSGLEVADVAVLEGYEDVNGQPKPQPFETYYYAQKYGLVAWEGELGRSYMVQEFVAGSQPNNQREVLPWLT